MRVIAGRAKGHRLAGPSSRATRPTSDLVRGAIFSALESMGVELTRVLDLYAGSGALGIEALSRGAQWCDFVERDARACASIRENLTKTRFGEQANVHCAAVERALAGFEGPYTLVLADPPYAQEGRPLTNTQSFLLRPAGDDHTDVTLLASVAAHGLRGWLTTRLVWPSYQRQGLRSALDNLQALFEPVEDEPEEEEPEEK